MNKARGPNRFLSKQHDRTKHKTRDAIGYRCISAAEATSFTLCTSIESKEGQHRDIEGTAHFLVIFIVYLEEQSIRIHFSKLADLLRIRQFVINGYIYRLKEHRHQESKIMKNIGLEMYLGMQSSATSTIRGIEINYNQSLTSIQQ